MTTRIGLRSTGLTVFASNVFAGFTGLIFLIMAARWLTPSELGLWEVIIDVVAFASFPIGVVSYWATRDIARGRLSGKTAYAIAIAMSAFGLGVYFVTSVLTSSSLATSFVPFLLGALLVPLSYCNTVTTSIVMGYKPIVSGYQLIVSEPIKLVVAYFALYIFDMGIEGVIVGLLASYLVTFSLGAYMTRGASADQLQVTTASRWFRRSWIPIISSLPPLLLTLDTYIASLGFGTAIAGVYQPAFTVSGIVMDTYFLTYSLYPLLLRGGDRTLPAIIIELLLLFSIPMAVGGAVLAHPILYLFGTKYMAGALGLGILSFMFLFRAMSLTVDRTLLGMETVDVGEEKGFSLFLKSNLFYVAYINIVSAIAYLGGMYVALWYAFSRNLGPSDAVALWSTVQLGMTLVFLLVKARRAGRSASLVRRGSRVPYYIGASAVMAAALYPLSDALLVTGVGGLVYGLELIIVIILGAAVYFGVLYLVEPGFKAMAHAVLRLGRSKFRMGEPAQG